MQNTVRTREHIPHSVIFEAVEIRFANIAKQVIVLQGGDCPRNQENRGIVRESEKGLK